MKRMHVADAGGGLYPAAESYRSAAFGVVVEEDESTLQERCALGTPILFSLGQRDVGVWRVGARAPLLLERVSLGPGLLPIIGVIRG